MKRFLLLSILIIAVSNATGATKDTLFMKNGDLVVGELKSMNKGVVIVETDYSDVDLHLKWGGIRRISTTSTYMLSLSSGEPVVSTIRSVNDSMVTLSPSDGSPLQRNLSDIVGARTVKQDFLSRFNASVDIGLSLTKARNQRQMTVNSRAGYVQDVWTTDAYYDDLFSSQDSTESIRRTNFGASYRYVFPANLYLAADATFLSNTEQSINMRSTPMLGGGYYVIHTNRALWSFGTGIAGNFETFTNGTAARNSYEAYIGTVVNLFNFGDLSFYTSAVAFPSLTESGRWRADVKIDAKYDLPLDLYVRAGVTGNYDNQPATAGTETDYVFTTGLGWKW